MSTHVLSTLIKHTTRFLVKNFGECCRSGFDDHLLLAIKSLPSCSEVYVHVSGVKSQPFTVGVGLNKGVCCHHEHQKIFFQGGKSGFF